MPNTFRALGVTFVAASALALAAAPAFSQGGKGHGAGGRDGSWRQARMMQILDTDGDGKISLAEITAEQRRLVAASDVDGNGTLSADEFRRRGGLFQRLGTTTLFDLMDADGDKILTAEEIQKPSERWLTRYDANGDGALDADELPQPQWRRGRR
ncbi:MAG: EF-hand domain-containing protein [Alphaproteobacteria bacterium]|nr:EF-hand domain-containing protein [Alphaproteobacteria bacterium]